MQQQKVYQQPWKCYVHYSSIYNSMLNTLRFPLFCCAHNAIVVIRNCAIKVIRILHTYAHLSLNKRMICMPSTRWLYVSTACITSTIPWNKYSGKRMASASVPTADLIYRYRCLAPLSHIQRAEDTTHLLQLLCLQTKLLCLQHRRAHHVVWYIWFGIQ